LGALASAAYQVEGRRGAEDGKGESNWDRFLAHCRGKVKGGATGDVSCDQYHRFQRGHCHPQAPEIRRATAFSTSVGTNSTHRHWFLVNKKGIDHYSRLNRRGCWRQASARFCTDLITWDLPQRRSKIAEAGQNRDLAGLLRRFSQASWRSTWENRITTWASLLTCRGHSPTMAYGIGRISSRPKPVVDSISQSRTQPSNPRAGRGPFRRDQGGQSFQSDGRQRFTAWPACLSKKTNSEADSGLRPHAITQ